MDTATDSVVAAATHAAAQTEGATATPARLPEFSHAFQPIVDIVTRQVYAHEALVRGINGEAAFHVLNRVPEALKYRFDEASRCAAIERAVTLGISTHLNLNCLPLGLNQGHGPISETLAAAARCGLPLHRIVLEVTESEAVTDPAHLSSQLQDCRAQGLKVAIDDFGAGYAGLNLLADFQPDQVKVDMGLVRGIDRHGPRQAIVRAIMQACEDLAIDVVVEGVETLAECSWFLDQGARLFQGYLFARPRFEGLTEVRFPGPLVLR